MSTELDITPGPWTREGRFGQKICRFWPEYEDALGGVELIATVSRLNHEGEANAQAIVVVPLYEDLRKAENELQAAISDAMKFPLDQRKHDILTEKKAAVLIALETLNTVLGINNDW